MKLNKETYMLYITLLLFVTFNLTTSYRSKLRTKIFSSLQAFAKKKVGSETKSTPQIPFDLKPDRPLTVRELGFEPNAMKKVETTAGTKNEVINKDSTNHQLDLSNSAIKFQTWIKFFKYQSNVQKKTSRAFFINSMFKAQNKDSKVAKEILYKDNEGVFINIPDETSFFASIYDNEMVISSSRKNFLQTNFDVLRFDLIKPIADEPGFHGGLSDFGNFKEGFCFKVLTSQSGSWTWVVCTKDDQDKKVMMQIIKQLKVSEELGEYTTSTAKKHAMLELESQKAKYMRENEALLGEKKQDSSNSRDGYWIILQDWSSCTKACGGGTMTLQRMCVPPKKGGKPCEGEAIMKKICNEKPCSTSTSMYTSGSESGNSVKPQIKEPHVSVLPFSDRPQRYQKCVVKEADLLMTVNTDDQDLLMSTDDVSSGQLGKQMQIPVRVVMNLETLTAYSGLEEKDLKATFNMKNAKIETSKRDSSCFIIKEIGKWKHNDSNNSEQTENKIFKNEFCPFGGNTSEELQNEWNYDFNLFKYQCHQSRAVKSFGEEHIEDELEAKKNQLRLDIISKKQIKAKLDIPADKGIIESKKKNILEILKKENRLERLVEKEMKESQKEALELKAEEVKKENCKLDALEKAMKLKEIENQFNVRKEKSAEKLAKMANEVKERIEMKRNKLKEKLLKLKEMTRKQMKGLDGQIQNIRLEVQKDELNESYDTGKCEAIRKSGDKYETEKTKYCNEKFSSSPDKLQDCLKLKSVKDLVNLCCNYETNVNSMKAYDDCVTPPGSEEALEASSPRRFWWDSKRYTDKLQTTDDLRNAFNSAASG